MHIRRIGIGFLVLALLLTSALTAIAEDAASVMTRDAEGQEVIAWGWDQPEFNKKVEDYILESAGVTINGQTMTGGDIMAKLIASAAAGTGMPDCFKLSSPDTAKLVEIGAVLDITDMVQPYLNLLPEVGWGMVTVGGRIYGIPANSPAAGMFYRYDVLEEYGIDPDELTTWDKWIEAGQKVVSESGGAVKWLNMPEHQMNGYVSGTIRQQYRAEVLSKDGSITVDSDEFRDALALIEKIAKADIADPMGDWSAPWYQSMKDGTIACYPSGTWFVQTMIMQAPDTQGKWYFTPFPAIEEGGDRYPNFGSATCYISSQTDKPEAAFEWCKAWTIDPQGSLRIGLEQLGISVISYAALNDDYVNQPNIYFAKDQAYWRVATEAFTNSTYIPPTLVQSGEANSIFNLYFDQWMAGEITADEALSQAAAELFVKLD